MVVQRPNLILITASHLHRDSLGYAGNPDAQTPNLDVLAAHGVSFSEATAGDIVGVQKALAGCLEGVGYRYGRLGRLAGEEQEDGYGTWLTAQGKEARVEAWARNSATASTLFTQSCGAMRSNLPAALSHNFWVGTEAVRFLGNMQEPFFLSVNFCKPAWPYNPGAPWDMQYKPGALTLPEGYDSAHAQVLNGVSVTEGRLRKALAFYYGLISQIDQQVGRILATLTARGISNNLIVFTADRGAYLGDGGLLHDPEGPLLASVKRVPLLVAGAGCTRKAAVDTLAVHHADLLPTLLGVIGVKVPKGTGGKKFTTALQG